jgi:small nuclear ribonucleoprotein (snRNP)-like protein
MDDLGRNGNERDQEEMQDKSYANSPLTVTGTLKGYDALMNLVLDDVDEVVRGTYPFSSPFTLPLLPSPPSKHQVLTTLPPRRRRKQPLHPPPRPRRRARHPPRPSQPRRRQRRNRKSIRAG